MKKLKWFPLVCLLAILPFLGWSASTKKEKNVVARAEEKNYASVYMIDCDTGSVLLSENETERRPIASMVKIMTLLLTFEEIDGGRMSLDEKILVSENAAGMGGSQLFLNAGTEYLVSDLVKGVTVCSANDGAAALAERISGTVEAFVRKMNGRAKSLGMEDTLFCNATGLPGGEQYSTARDVTVMMKELLKHRQYFDYTKIWMENFVHPDGRMTQIVNTNKLIRTGSHCDAGKTGFTNEAKFCLSASGKVNDMRVICTVLGFNDGKERFKKVNEWMNDAFARYENKVYVKANEPIESDVAVRKGKSNLTNVYCDRDLKAFGKKGEMENYTVRVSFDENLCAPIAKGTPVGTIGIVSEEGEISTGILHAGCDIDKMSFLDNLKYILQNKIVKWKK